MGVTDEKKTGLGFRRTCGWLALFALVGTVCAAASFAGPQAPRKIRDAMDAGLAFVLCFGVFGALTDERPRLAQVVLVVSLIAWAFLR